MTGLFTYSIWLSLVLSHPSVNCSELLLVSSFGVLLVEELSSLNDVWSDWCLEYGGKRMSRPTGGTIMRSNGDRRTRRHG